MGSDSWFKRITNCSDMIIAYLIKDSAAQGSELQVCLRDIGHEEKDGMLDIQDVGLEGIRERMKEDVGPKLHHMAQQARMKYENTRRKFKERPKWFFRRLRANEMLMKKYDPDHKPSASYKAQLVLNNSGLERKEREKVFKEAKAVWDDKLFEQIILERYEIKHELDCVMINTVPG